MAKTQEAASLTRLDVDFNARTREGYVRLRLPRGEAQRLQPGDRVTAVDPVDGIQAEAVLARVNQDSGVAALEVDWHSFEEVPARSSPAATTPRWLGELHTTGKITNLCSSITNVVVLGLRPAPIRVEATWSVPEVIGGGGIWSGRAVQSGPRLAELNGPRSAQLEDGWTLSYPTFADVEPVHS